MSYTDILAPQPSGPDRAAQGEAALIDAGWAAWRRTRADALASRLEAADDLVLALDAYDAIHSGAVHPAAWWPDLGNDPRPWDTGLRRAAGDVLERLAALITQAPALAEEQA